MSFKLLILSTALLSSCGMKIRGLESLENIEAKGDIKTDIPEKISFEPDFKNAIETCDNRYGVGTEESEDCFQDFRDYYKTSIGFDFSGLIEFCEERYNTELEIEACQDELLDIIGDSEFQNIE